jgi:hypothetical protein
MSRDYMTRGELPGLVKTKAYLHALAGILPSQSLRSAPNFPVPTSGMQVQTKLNEETINHASRVETRFGALERWLMVERK